MELRVCCWHVRVCKKPDFASVTWLGGGTNVYVIARQIGYALAMLRASSLDVWICADECDDARLTMQLKKHRRHFCMVWLERAPGLLRVVVKHVDSLE